MSKIPQFVLLTLSLFIFLFSLNNITQNQRCPVRTLGCAATSMRLHTPYPPFGHGTMGLATLPSPSPLSLRATSSNIPNTLLNKNHELSHRLHLIQLVL